MPALVAPYHLDEYLPPLAGLLPSAEAVLSDEPEGDTPWARFAAVRDLVATEVERLAGLGRGRVDVVTGDCLCAVGTVLGLQRSGFQNLGVVWFDAHGDANTVDSSVSGYAGGMPLRILAGHRPPEWDDVGGLVPLAEDRIVLAGARDLDPPEEEYLSSSAVRQVAVPELDAAVLPSGPLLLHVDVDVVDAGDVPGLRYPVMPGPSASELVAAVQRVLAGGEVVALEVACTWFPEYVTPAGPALLRELLSV